MLFDLLIPTLLTIGIVTPIACMIAFRVGIYYAERTFKRMYGCLYCGGYELLDPQGCFDIHCMGNPQYDEYAESQLRHPRGRIRGVINQLLSRYRFN